MSGNLMGNCRDCYYWYGEYCRRYPKPLKKDAMEYCGEFASYRMMAEQRVAPRKVTL